MAFKSAVEATPEIQDAWKTGLQALRPTDAQHVDVHVTRRLCGSVDLDTTLAKSLPNDPRWDYGIGYRRVGCSDTVYWVEIHPAGRADVNAVLSKLVWLKNWLENRAPRLNALQKEFVWVSSGRTTLTPSSPQAKRLAQAGLRHVGRRLRVQ